MVFNFYIHSIPKSPMLYVVYIYICIYVTELIYSSGLGYTALEWVSPGCYHLQILTLLFHIGNNNECGCGTFHLLDLFFCT